MCGIAGIMYASPERRVDPGLLDRMAHTIAHRGPNDSSVWTTSGVGLAHRRLSIIDLEGGHQPIGNEDGSIQVIFNGEIYNYRDLRTDLQARGHILRTGSDTEVLVHSYEEWGDEFVTRLRGMFAFAIWDGRRRRMLLGRDRLGIKPLYIYRDPEKLLFASELKAILADPSVARQVDDGALQEYLAFGRTLGERSIFRGISKLPPGHVVAASFGSLERTPRRYWQLELVADERLSVPEWQRAVHDKVTDAVKAHLVADVPVGAFLSGGLDSSIVVACASGLVDQPLQTFSIGFNEQHFNELPYAKAVADAFHTRHTEQTVTADAVSLMGELARYYDEPFGDSSAIPVYLVSRLASRSVRVVLSGDGGDEAFGGYSRYIRDLSEDRVRRLLPSWVRRNALSRLGRAWPRSDWLPKPLRGKSWLTNVARDAGSAYARTLSIADAGIRQGLMAPDRAGRLDVTAPEAVIQAAYEAQPTRDTLTAMCATDIATTLPDDYLVKVDRASMAHGLEVRPPLLDHELIEFAMRIPSRYKVRGGKGKWIFSEAFAPDLPPIVRSRPKQGFELPVDEWLRGPLRGMFESSVLSASAPIAGLVDQEAARLLYASHLRGWHSNGQILWSLLALGAWAEHYLHGRDVQAESPPLIHA
jgi:asparagine synthase (glutamine-hydrolysing)